MKYVCFYLELKCTTDASKARDCGFPGITASACREKGCCYNEWTVRGAPWCFYPEGNEYRFNILNIFIP